MHSMHIPTTSPPSGDPFAVQLTPPPPSPIRRIRIVTPKGKSALAKSITTKSLSKKSVNAPSTLGLKNAARGVAEFDSEDTKKAPKDKTGGETAGSGNNSTYDITTFKPSSFHYPTDPGLPWHFCWIDDGMIGGMSVPTEPHHLRSLQNANIGLIVNLTEHPLTPNPTPTPCPSCSSLSPPYPPTLFSLLPPTTTNTTTPTLRTLHLPLHDGSIPHPTQLTSFLTHTHHTIQRGLKVVVHCQAGVGRTGTFLAIYLLNKYPHLTPMQVMERLRRVRPQSMRFHARGWGVDDPFTVYEEEDEGWVRNAVQERFVEWYWREVLGGSGKKKAKTTVGEEKKKEGEGLQDMKDLFYAVIDAEIEDVMRGYEAVDAGAAAGAAATAAVESDATSTNPTINPPTFTDLTGKCLACRNIRSIGPYPLHNTSPSLIPPSPRDEIHPFDQPQSPRCASEEKYVDAAEWADTVPHEWVM
ncbi:hypothetical protein HK104_000054 [Borealophlyctis nickersoniae]|nr:hypothetical protein HK104_000054 [Borealophlyctis nickersoniae]